MVLKQIQNFYLDPKLGGERRAFGAKKPKQSFDGDAMEVKDDFDC
jgi:hypothetical protein